MATEAQIGAAAAAARPTAAFSEAYDHHHVLATPRGTDHAEQRERMLAARNAVRYGRTPQDRHADALLDMLGLSHADANPGPSPRAQRLKALGMSELLAEIRRETT